MKPEDAAVVAPILAEILGPKNRPRQVIIGIRTYPCQTMTVIDGVHTQCRLLRDHDGDIHEFEVRGVVHKIILSQPSR